jgi:isopenicillin-N epimerase
VRLRDEFMLAPGLAFLNHASYGATPRRIFERRREIQLEIEVNPLPALTSQYEPRLDDARAVLAGHIGANEADIVWIPNTTFGMNQIARSLLPRLEPGDEVLLTDHEYGSVMALWQWLCEAHGARAVLQPIPVPLPGARAEAILAGITPRTRIIVVSHITTDTAAVLPVEEVAREARRLGITTVVDGAHAVGHIPLDLSSIRYDYYVGDLHKWACAPRPTGFLATKHALEPLVVSGRKEFFGTTDPSGWLTVPDSLDFHTRELAAAVPAARTTLADLDDPLVGIGCRPVTQALEDHLLMRSWILPAHVSAEGLRDKHEVEVQVVPGSRWGPLLRVSVAWYTEPDEVTRLVGALRAELR